MEEARLQQDPMTPKNPLESTSKPLLPLVVGVLIAAGIFVYSTSPRHRPRRDPVLEQAVHPLRTVPCRCRQGFEVGWVEGDCGRAADFSCGVLAPPPAGTRLAKAGIGKECWCCPVGVPSTELQCL